MINNQFYRKRCFCTVTISDSLKIFSCQYRSNFSRSKLFNLKLLETSVVRFLRFRVNNQFYQKRCFCTRFLILLKFFRSNFSHSKLFNLKFLETRFNIDSSSNFCDFASTILSNVFKRCFCTLTISNSLKIFSC